MEHGQCKLCLLEKPLCDSHLIPRAAYDYCRPPDGNPLVANSKLIIQSSRQLQHPLLCDVCEDVLNDGGENWVVPLFARYDGTFGFFDFLDIKPDKLIHFALGIFWKAAVHAWAGGRREPLIELGKYREPTRRFLRSETGFPERMALNIGVMRPPVKDIAFLAPFRTDEHTYHRFYFYTSGICWTLSVGKSVDDELRLSCFAVNPGRPIIVGNFSPDVRHVFSTILRFAKKAQNVGKYLKPESKP